MARRSHLSIIAVIAAFAWLLATTFAALLWICIPPLKNSNWWIILSGVSIHEIVRYIFVHLYYRTDKILRQANERVPFTDESSALAAGVGYAAMSSLVLFGSVLADGFGPGTFFLESCGSMSVFVLQALTTGIVSPARIMWMVLGFRAYRRDDSGLRCSSKHSQLSGISLLLLHFSSGLASLMNQLNGMCGYGLLIQLLVLSFTALAYWKCTS